LACILFTTKDDFGTGLGLSQGTGKLILVDDEVLLLSLAQEILSQNYYQVLKADSADFAQKILE